MPRCARSRRPAPAVTMRTARANEEKRCHLRSGVSRPAWADDLGLNLCVDFDQEHRKPTMLKLFGGSFIERSMKSAALLSIVLIIMIVWKLLSYAPNEPYGLYPKDLQISDFRSGNETQALYKMCVKEDICECFFDSLFQETSRLERVLFLYWDMRAVRRMIQLAARQRLNLSEEA